MRRMRWMACLLLLCSVLVGFMNDSSATLSSLSESNSNVVLVTLDGYRWQELFGGADSVLVRQKKYVGNVAQLTQDYWRADATDRRAALMPFLWSYAVGHGLMLGDRYEGGRMQVANAMHFSYPGYNEDLCGFPDDDHINSNDKKPNPNVSVLEAANKLPQYRNRVLAFGSWDNFPYILNEQRSGLEVNAGYRHSLSKHPTEAEKVIDQMQDDCPRRWDNVRFDAFTFHYALEAMKTRHPKLLYVAFGETDDYAHDGRYDQYLAAAHRADDFIRRLWEYAQSDPFYRDNTTFIITCDHGRGIVTDGLGNWRSHGADIPHSDETWLVAFGKGVAPRGIVKDAAIYYNKQIAPTVAAFLGIAFQPKVEGAGTAIRMR